MKRMFFWCLLPTSLLGVLCAPLDASAMPIYGDFAAGDLLDNSYVDFDVNISGTSNITDVNLLIQNLIAPETPGGPVPDYLNQVEAYLLFNGESLLVWQGLTGSTMFGTNFTDAATDEIDISGVEPYTGTFLAQQSSFGTRETPTITSFAGFGGGSFSGLNANGTWKLRIYDTQEDGNVGSFNGGRLTFAGNTSSNTVPVPPQFLATAIAGGLGVLKTRRQQKAKTEA
jgi:hypothetical protein